MATAEEILQTMAEVPESAPVCVIDPETQTIIVPPEYQLFGVENDKRTKRMYFQCPKIVGDNQDLSQNYQLFMNYQNANGDPDAYHIEDMEVDGDNITFSWLLEENVTKYRGNIQFAFGAIIPGDDAEDPDKNRWNTTINTDCTCLVGLKCTQQVAESNPDALVQIWAAIDELKAGGGGTGGTTNYNNLSNKPRLNGVTLEGNKTLDQVGVLAKNQGASNSGKYLSVGSDGNVVPADAPSGGTVDPEQIKQAVNGYLEENPVSGMTAEQEQQLNQNTTDVADLKSALPDKLDTNQGAENKGKSMVVGEDGGLVPENVKVNVDSTLSNEGEAADAKATGEALANKAKNAGWSSEKIIVTDKAGNMIEKDESEIADATDTNGNKYKLYVNSDGTIYAEKIYEKFPGKTVVSEIDMNEAAKIGDEVQYTITDKATGQEIRGVYAANNDGICQFRTYDLGDQKLTFSLTKAYEDFVSNTSGAFSIVTSFDASESMGNSVRSRLYVGAGHVIANNRFGSNGWDSIFVELVSIPYINTSGEKKTHSVSLKESSKIITEMAEATDNWNLHIFGYSFEENGEINVYWGHDLVYTFEKPSDFKSWDLEGVNGSTWADGVYNKKLYPDNKILYIADSINENDIDDYYKFLSGKNSLESIKSNDFVGLQIGGEYELYINTVPKGYEDRLKIEAETNDISLTGRKIKALAEGNTKALIKGDDIEIEVPVSIGKQVSDESAETIGELSTRVINDIVIVNEEDIPALQVGDELAVYAIGINTSDDVPYSVNDQNMVNFSSIDPSICAVEYGVLHANKAGETTITAASMDGMITKTFTVTVTEDSNKTISEYDTYRVNDRTHGIYNNGTNAESTTQGIQDALDYAHEQGYKKIIFNSGNYLIDPSNCPITIPSDMIVDFNGSIIRPVEKNTYVAGSKAYAIFKMEDIKNSYIINAKVYAENFYGDSYHVEQIRSIDILGNCENVIFENCEFSYSPGFNFCIGYYFTKSGGGDTRTALRLDNVEPGGIDDSGSPTSKSNTYRTINFMNLEKLKDNFCLGNMQGFQGYLYMSSRLYNIYFYDAEYAFISAKKWCVQYQSYPLPEEVVYCKIEFFQTTAPSNSEGDYGGIAHLCSIRNPKNIQIKKCIFKENVSTAISPQGGKNILIEDCYFENNGLIDPSSTIDWEDGRIHIQGHVLRNNEFCLVESTKKWNGQLNIINGRDITIHDNEIRVPFYNKDETQNSRIYRNRFIGQASNQLTLASKGDMIFAMNLYETDPNTTTPVGGSIIMADNQLI